MPLAIELAAARVDSLGLRELSSRLQDPLHILTRGRRSAAPRHQTLRALLDWSFDLLLPAEQTVLCRLSVFRGGFTLDSASVVAADDELGANDVIECVLGLTVKSLITADASGDGSGTDCRRRRMPMRSSGCRSPARAEQYFIATPGASSKCRPVRWSMPAA